MNETRVNRGSINWSWNMFFFHTWPHNAWWEVASIFQCIVLKLWSSKILTHFVLLHQTRGKGPDFPTKVGKLVPQVKQGDLSCLENRNLYKCSLFHWAAATAMFNSTNENNYLRPLDEIQEKTIFYTTPLDKFLASSQSKDSHRFCFSDSLYAREDTTYGLHRCGAEVNFATLQLCMYMVSP